MKGRSRIAILGITLSFVLAGAAVAAPKSDPATVGWFLKEIASARHLTANTEPEAIAAIKASGISLPALDPAKALTEGDVVSIGRAFGVTLTTQAPATTFDRTHASQIVPSFGAQPGADGANRTDSQGGDPGQSGNGKGKKKGHNKSSSEPL